MRLCCIYYGKLQRLKNLEKNDGRFRNSEDAHGCPSDETGRRKRLKISRFRKGRAGSIPASGTKISLYVSYVLLACCAYSPAGFLLSSERR